VISRSGGVSVGEEDHVKAAVEAEGRLEMWKIAIKPGKAAGFWANQFATDVGEVAFIGCPATRCRAFVTFVMLVRPFPAQHAGVCQVAPASYLLRADFDWLQPGRAARVPACQNAADGGVELFANQSSGVLTSAVWG
jgi:molybdopterin molybdotransferase